MPRLGFSYPGHGHRRWLGKIRWRHDPTDEIVRGVVETVTNIDPLQNHAQFAAHFTVGARNAGNRMAPATAVAAKNCGRERFIPPVIAVATSLLCDPSLTMATATPVRTAVVKTAEMTRPALNGRSVTVITTSLAGA